MPLKEAPMAKVKIVRTIQELKVGDKLITHDKPSNDLFTLLPDLGTAHLEYVVDTKSHSLRIGSIYATDGAYSYALKNKQLDESKLLEALKFVADRDGLSILDDLAAVPKKLAILAVMR